MREPFRVYHIDREPGSTGLWRTRRLIFIGEPAAEIRTPVW